MKKGGINMLSIKKHYPTFDIDITLTAQITVVMGDSGAGKTLLYNMIPSIVNGVKVYRYNGTNPNDSIIRDIESLTNVLIILDRIEYLFTEPLGDELLQAINKSSNTFLLFGRNTTGLNMELKDIKKLVFVNSTLKLEDIFKTPAQDVL